MLAVVERQLRTRKFIKEIIVITNIVIRQQQYRKDSAIKQFS
jgi:hypothetical protein